MTTSKRVKNTKTAKTVWEHKPRVVSFKKSSKAGYLAPVNNRACKLMGQRKFIRPEELLQVVGYHKVMVYTKNNSLKALKV